MRTPLLVWLTIPLLSSSIAACGDDAGSGPLSGMGGAGGAAEDSGAAAEGAGGAVEDGGGAGGAAEGAGGAAEGGVEAAGAGDLVEQLRAIPGLTVEEQDSDLPGYRYLVMEIEQPADHGEPDGARFQQRLVLHHRDPAAPVVLVTEGYSIYPESQWLDEPAELLAANQIRVEHRFFTPSRPAPADWSMLTIEQAAADLHHVIASIRPLYQGKWISTGVSKGGMTSVYHRRFFPADVDGTVAYVAPHSLGGPDPRYLDFVAERGEPACRKALQDFQREALLRRSAMVERMEDEAAKEGFAYDVLGVERTLEVAVLDTVFSFWQYQRASLCADVPTAASSDEEVWAFLEEVASPSLWSDPYLLAFEPYHWQAATQLGYPGVAEAHLADLLKHPGTDVPPAFVLSGPGKTPAYDPGAMQDVSRWLTSEGERFLFIYGENDPYTAAAFELGQARDAHRFIAPEGNHGAVIGELAPADREQALKALEAWTGVAPSPHAPTSLRRPLRDPRWRMRL
ncbi:S28 family serine protease [Sorangium sp. So ce1036]|uniref:S28 family serine protease n=1 Tax=Sorangium sp. So ce1036 TaxID=3133328 RepID=UPI003F044449